MVAIAVVTYGMQNSYSAHLSLSFCCPHFMCLKSYAAVLKYLLCLTVIVGLLLLLYTIDDARCVMVWCESYVVVMDQFCEIDFVSAKVTEQELQNPV